MLAVATASALGSGPICLANNSTLEALANLTFTADQALNILGTVTINANGYTITFLGPVTGAGSIVTTGGGTVFFAGNASSGYSGALTVLEGIADPPRPGAARLCEQLGLGRDGRHAGRGRGWKRGLAIDHIDNLLATVAFSPATTWASIRATPRLPTPATSPTRRPIRPWAWSSSETARSSRPATTLVPAV